MQHGIHIAGKRFPQQSLILLCTHQHIQVAFSLLYDYTEINETSKEGLRMRTKLYFVQLHITF